MMRTKVFEQDEITNATRSISFVNKEGQGRSRRGVEVVGELFYSVTDRTKRLRLLQLSPIFSIPV